MAVHRVPDSFFLDQTGEKVRVFAAIPPLELAQTPMTTGSVLLAAPTPVEGLGFRQPAARGVNPGINIFRKVLYTATFLIANINQCDSKHKSMFLKSSLHSDFSIGNILGR